MFDRIRPKLTNRDTRFCFFDNPFVDCGGLFHVVVIIELKNGRSSISVHFEHSYHVQTD